MRRTSLFVSVAALAMLLAVDQTGAAEEDRAPRPNIVFMMADWKLKLLTRQNSEEVELFNLADDIAEKNNVADAHPEKARDLRTRYDRLAAQAVPPKNRESKEFGDESK